ncbi:PH domain-containing protein [Xylariales sp. PMI_506]|nr:PH domain-containing protein [Xylariales sp. PMI_506]
MAETTKPTQVESPALTAAKLPGRGARIAIPSLSGIMAPNPITSRLRTQLGLGAASPVNQNGSFEFDRVIKSGYVQKRTQKTKTWKTVFLVLRPNTLSIYKSDKESKLRHKLYLSELSAVTLLKDPKQKRHNLFGLFSPAKNFHLEAPSPEDAKEWVELIRQDARIEEEEEEMFLASPIVRRQSYAAVGVLGNGTKIPKPSNPGEVSEDNERPLSSSPEPAETVPGLGSTALVRRPSHTVESVNEFLSHSDFSDTEMPAVGASIENLAVRSPSYSAGQLRPVLGGRNLSQLSGLNIETDPDRVVWQGWLQFLKSKRGVKQWKHCWAVLRPRNLILYKDESEYTAAFILALSSIVNAVDIDPINKSKLHCMQIITDEKSYRFSAPDEETLVQCLGAFKSLLSKRKELEARQNPDPGVGGAAQQAL